MRKILLSLAILGSLLNFNSVVFACTSSSECQPTQRCDSFGTCVRGSESTTTGVQQPNIGGVQQPNVGGVQQPLTNGLNITPPAGLPTNIGELFNNVISFILLLVIPIATIMVLYSGWLFLVGGDDNIKKAKQNLWWIFIGLVVIAISSSLPNVIQSILLGN